MKVFLYVFDKKDLLYTKIYTKDRTVRVSVSTGEYCYCGRFR